MGCQERRETLDKRVFRDLQEAQENLELLAFRGCLVSKEIREHLVFLVEMGQLAILGAKEIWGVRDLLEQEVDQEQQLLLEEKASMDCQGSQVLMAPQEGMGHQGYPEQRGSLDLARMEKLVKKVRGVHRDR